MKQASKPFSVLVEKTLQKYSLSKNISIITNRNNYAHGLICQDCGTIPMCKQCDVAINFYKQTNGSYIGLCNYCKTEYPSQSSCSHCQGHNLDFYGYGAQQIQSILSDSYSIHANILDASKLNSHNKISQLTHT
jgi:primosomal protein N' (replication factor Y) (superfamily II helicase)